MTSTHITMQIQTLSEVIAAARNEPLTGLTGIVKHVFEPKQDDTGSIRQTVVVADGPHEVMVSITDPETHGGVVPQSLKGRKIYLLPGLNSKGKPCGLKRGGDYAKRSGVGMNHYVNCDREGSWSTSDEKVTPEPVKAAGSFEDDDVPMSFGTPPPKPAPAPIPPQPVQRFDPMPTNVKVIDSDALKRDVLASCQEVDRKIVASPEVRFAALVLRHRECIEAAIDTARSVKNDLGEVTGEAFSASDIASMGSRIFAEAHRSGFWK